MWNFTNHANASCAAHDFLLSDSSLSPPLRSSRSCVRFDVLVSNVSSASIIVPSILFCTHRYGGPRRSHADTAGFCRPLQNVHVEIRSSRFHCRPLFCWTCIIELFTSTVKDHFVWIPRMTKANYQEFLNPGSLQETRLTTRQISAPRGVNSMNSSVLSFLPANTRLFHRGSNFVSSASWSQNKENSQNSCRSPCHTHVYAVRPSFLIWNRLGIHEP